MTDQTAAIERARRRILDRHGAVVAAVDACADDVAADWDAAAVADRTRVVEPFERRLRDAGVLSSLPAVLADGVDAAGYDLAARPVAAPPYVVVTSTGPVLRATVADGRLVVAFRAFEVVRSGDDEWGNGDGEISGADGDKWISDADGDERARVRYARRNVDPESSVEVTLR